MEAAPRERRTPRRMISVLALSALVAGMLALTGGAAAAQTVVNIKISSTSPLGKGSGTVFWSTDQEIDVIGFNVVTIDSKGTRVQQNDVLIRCNECFTGNGADYSFVIAKHKSGANIYIEMLRVSPPVETYGPAVKT